MQFGIIVMKNLMRRKTRSILTIIGISVGIGAVVSLVSITQGFVSLWEVSTARRGSDLLVFPKTDASNTLFSSMDQSLQEELKIIPGIKKVASTLVDVVTIDDWPWIFVYGQELDSFVLSHLNVLKGKGLTPGEKEILIGKILAQNLNITVGDDVDIEADIFKVVGIFESGTVYEDGLVFMDINQLQELMDRGKQVTSFEIQAEDRTLIPSIKEAVAARLPSLTAMEGKEVGEGDFGITLARALSWGVSCIALFVGLIGTLNTMYMSVFERTKEIGILRALGWRSSRVLRMILGEAVVLSLLGGIIGCFLGVQGVNLITLLPPAQSIIYGKYSLILFLQAMVIAFTMGVGGGFYPAYRAASLSPMEAIRYE